MAVVSHRAEVFFLWANNNGRDGVNISTIDWIAAGGGRRQTDRHLNIYILLHASLSTRPLPTSFCKINKRSCQCLVGRLKAITAEWLSRFEAINLGSADISSYIYIDMYIIVVQQSARLTVTGMTNPVTLTVSTTRDTFRPRVSLRRSCIPRHK